MGNKELKVIIGTDGTARVEANGFSGGVCEKTINQLIMSVGGSETSEEKKPEYYDENGDNFNELFTNV